MASAHRTRSVSRPLGVIVLSLLAAISGIQMLLSSLWLFALSANSDKPEVIDALSRISAGLARSAAGLFFVVGLVFLVLAISYLVLAKGYYDGRERARRRGRAISAFAIVWAVLGIVLLPARVDPGSPLWTILINAVIILYLGRDSVKAFFRN